MKYYPVVTTKDQLECCMVLPPYTALTSYFYFKDKVPQVKALIADHKDIFVDCGAFSAQNSQNEKKKTINIDEYCKWLILINAKVYAGLDVIGNAKKTKENMKYMIDEYDLNPIPTFHLGSTIDDLKEMVHGQYSYIALGGLVFSKNIMRHCDQVWHYILTHNPNLRVHGFGITNLDLMKRYPWYSVDSSSFTSCERFGRQTILFGNEFEMQTFDDTEYVDILRSMGFVFENTIHVHKDMTKSEKEQALTINRNFRNICRIQSAQSFRLFAAYLKELNKTRKFDWLKAQGKLFE